MSELDRMIEAARAGALPAVVLIAGDRVLSEPAALRIAEVAAARSGCRVLVHRKPAGLASIIADLETFSLFDAAKVALVVETSMLADAKAAADLLDQAIENLPLADPQQLSEREREAAGRLLQVLHLFGVDPRATAPEGVIAALPRWALAGGAALRRKRQGRGRTPKQVHEVEEGLVALLAAALEAGLQGWAENDLAALAELVERGLPQGHQLVLAESVVAAEHPLVKRLKAGQAMIAVGSVSTDRRGAIAGLDAVARELERETGVAIEPKALEELARRTLRKQTGSDAGIEATSTARLAAEFRKLAGLASAGPIDLHLVREVVEDRGEEDVWALLDDLGAGRTADGIARMRRLMLGAADPMNARLSLFSLLADFASRVTSVHSLLQGGGIAAGERNYRRFEVRQAKQLQSELEGGYESPLAGLHPFRLHRIYLAASRLRERDLRGLASMVLDVDLRLKGESGDPDAALWELAMMLGSGVVDPQAAGERPLLRQVLAAVVGAPAGAPRSGPARA